MRVTVVIILLFVISAVRAEYTVFAHGAMSLANTPMARLFMHSAQQVKHDTQDCMAASLFCTTSERWVIVEEPNAVAMHYNVTQFHLIQKNTTHAPHTDGKPAKLKCAARVFIAGLIVTVP